MCERLMEEMAAEEQQAVEECEVAERQRVRWADMEEGQTVEKEAGGGSEIESEKSMSHESWIG